MGVPQPREYGPLLVTAWLASPLANEPPHLDAILEWAISPYFLEKDPAVIEPWKITRASPAPPQAVLPIPLRRQQLGLWQVSMCSNPILGTVAAETVEHVCKRIAVEAAGLLREDQRLVVSTTNSWTKSYRLPLRVRSVPCVRWFAFGRRRELLKLLKGRVQALGKKRSDGYARVREWTVEKTDADYSWYAPHPSGTLLMRTLPVGDWLPKDLVGYRRDFGACCPPYWHPERYGEIVAPC